MPMQYRDFDLDAFDYEENADGERFSVRVANSPAGQQRLSDAEQVPILPNLRSQLRQLERRSLDLGEMIDLGKLLNPCMQKMGALKAYGFQGDSDINTL